MTGKINSYKDLIVWQQAMDLAVTSRSPNALALLRMIKPITCL